MTLPRKIEKINELLIGRFGVPEKNKKLPDPVELLVATILSQNTNDSNSYKAYRNLMDTYSSWEEVINAPLEKLQEVIRTAGLIKQKSSSIQQFLSQVKEKNGSVSLSYITQKGNNEILEELTSFKGVGFKTASCVLLFSLDKNVCPVDTHVHRTVNRIGLVSEKTPDKTFFKLNENFPDGIAHSFHTNLIRLGREICRPKKTFCAECPLYDLCGYESKTGESGGKKENKFMLLDNIGDIS